MGDARQVLVLAPDAFGTGGIERVTRTLIRSLADRYGRNDVGVVSVWGGDADLPARILHQGRRSGGGRHVMFTEKATFVASALYSAWQWRRRLVVVACHPNLAPVAWAAGQISGAAVAIWSHGDEVWGPLRPSVRFAMRRAGLVFAPSRFTADQAVHWAGLKRRPVVVP